MAIKTRHLTVYVDPDIIAWPGHRKDILDKIIELEELIDALETGQTENWLGYLS